MHDESDAASLGDTFGKQDRDEDNQLAVGQDDVHPLCKCGLDVRATISTSSAL